MTGLMQTEEQKQGALVSEIIDSTPHFFEKQNGPE